MDDGWGWGMDPMMMGMMMNMDMWGGAGANYGWGPWASIRGKGDKGGKGGSPYGGGDAGGSKKKKASSAAAVSHGPIGDLPEVVFLSIGGECSFVQQGFPAEVPAIEYSKSIDIFSEAHH